MKSLKITVIAFLFPPISGAGCHRPLRFVNYWAKKGYKVNVISGHLSIKKYFSYIDVDPELINSVDKNVSVKHIASIHPIEFIRYKLKRYKKSAPSVGSKHSDAKSYNAAHRKHANDGLHAVKNIIGNLLEYLNKPDPFWGWLFNSLIVILSSKKCRSSDFIYATGYPWTPLILATLVGKILKIPIILDYRDPWHLNPYSQGENNITFKIEKWVNKQATLIITNTNSMNEFYQSIFPLQKDKMYPFLNAIDSAKIQDFKKIIAEVEYKKADKIVITHVGTVYRERMPPTVVNLLTDLAATNKNLVFQFIGKFLDDRSLVDAFTKRGLENHLVILGMVDNTRAIKYQVQSDLLLLLQSGTDIQIPAKIFEYVLARKPILSISNYGSEVNSLIKKYHLGYNICEHTNQKDINKFIEKVSLGRVDQANYNEFLNDFNSDVISLKLEQLIRENIISDGDK
jgi:glycosyltransferase involved in cell wall biosynthesis